MFMFWRILRNVPPDTEFLGPIHTEKTWLGHRAEAWRLFESLPCKQMCQSIQGCRGGGTPLRRQRRVSLQSRVALEKYPSLYDFNRSDYWWDILYKFWKRSGYMFNSFITSNMPYFLSPFQLQRVHPKSSLFFNISGLYESQGIIIVWRRRYESCATRKCGSGFWLFCMLCSRHVRAMSLPDVRATYSLYELGLRHLSFHPYVSRFNPTLSIF
jgi:hypothetical protein